MLSPTAVIATKTFQSDSPEDGLTAVEAASILKTDGPNTVVDVSPKPLLNLLSKFWAPIPWLLETALVLEALLHKYAEVGVIASLLLFNAVLAFVQEGRAQATLDALRKRLALSASVLRDGTWMAVPAAQLVRGDVVKLTLGAVVAADVRLLGGSVLLDQSMLTGESLPIEAAAKTETFAGALVRRGEATAVVTATGSRTKFGRTAELVRTAKTVSSQQKAVLQIVRNLAIFNGCVILIMAGFALLHSLPRSELIALVLTAILSAIPVGLPATFTLAAALGARALAGVGVLPTRLSAVDEAGTIDVLCADKTGTLTANQLTVTSVRAFAGAEEARVLALGALASSEGGADPVDAAIRDAASHKPYREAFALKSFIPFDPAKKTAEALVTGADGKDLRVVKGAYQTVAGQSTPDSSLDASVAELEQQGYRVLAVATDSATGGNPLQIVGLIALSDPPRSDARDLIAELDSLGVRTIMVTGDAAITAITVAKEVGLRPDVCPAGPLPATLQAKDFAIFAGVLPEGKFTLVKILEANGSAVGMCGDGANDAPALRQAQIGIAVSTATDVAKSAAGVVLTEPGLSGVVSAVKEGRITFQRVLSYTLRSISHKITQIMLLVVGLMMTGTAILTPMLVLILMVSGDFLAMSLATDRVTPSPAPNSWGIGRITLAGIFFGLSLLLFCTGVLAVGKYGLDFQIGQLRTLAVIALVYGSQAVSYAVRGRQHVFGLRPTKWLPLATCADLLLISILAGRGIAMDAVPLVVLFGLFGAAVIFWLLISLLKIPILKKLDIA